MMAPVADPLRAMSLIGYSVSNGRDQQLESLFYAVHHVMQHD